MTRRNCSRIHSRLNWNSWHRGRLHERGQVVQQVLGVDVGGHEALGVQLLGDLVGVAQLRDPQDPAHRGRQSVGQPGHQTEVDDPEPAVASMT